MMTTGVKILTMSRTAPKRRELRSWKIRWRVSHLGDWLPSWCPGEGGRSWNPPVCLGDGHLQFRLQQSEDQGQGSCFPYLQDESRKTSKPSPPPSLFSKLPFRFNGCATLQLSRAQGNFCIVTIEVSCPVCRNMSKCFKWKPGKRRLVHGKIFQVWSPVVLTSTSVLKTGLRCRSMHWTWPGWTPNMPL